MAGKSSKNGANANSGKRKRDGKNKAKVWLVVILIAIAAVIAAIVALDKYGERVIRPVIEEKISGKTGLREIKVYFISEDGGGLVPEKRLAKRGSPEDEIKEALGMLIEGPQERRLSSAIPEGTKLRSVSLKDDIATADFSGELVSKHPGGSAYEILTVYSIVDTVALNFPQVKEVMILVDGKKTGTIAGHIDTTAPFTADKSLIRGAGEKP